MTNSKLNKCPIPQCERCKLNKPFDLSDVIVDACNTGNLVIFAGAGVSTETKGVYPSSFYKNVKNELKIPEKKNISFSKLMTLYCAPPRSRKDLLLEIKDRIDYVKTFSELYNRVTEFHQELSTIPHIHEIFTTNWDDFFEKECNATPVVTGEDFAIFQDIPGRRVFKIHGSIYNYGSIVATEQDYKKCYKRLNTGIIGAKLKMHLLSKIMVFVGFSFDDEDFQQLYKLLKKQVGGIIPNLFVVTLDENAEKKLHSMKINATPIITSGTFFLHRLKNRLVQDMQIFPDYHFAGISKMLDKVMKEHAKLSKLSLIKHPDALYSLTFQDGLQHAFQHILNNRHTGIYYPERILNVIDSYDVIIKQSRKIGNYPDVSYFTGYQTGQICLMLEQKDRKHLPMYYVPGYKGGPEINTYKEFLKIEKNAARHHKSAHKFAVKMVSKIKSDKLVFHRTPFL